MLLCILHPKEIQRAIPERYRQAVPVLFELKLKLFRRTDSKLYVIIAMELINLPFPGMV